MPTPINFLTKALIENLYIPEPNSGCWLWMGDMFQQGYGRIKCCSVTYKAHQASYIVHKGPIPVGSIVRHGCNVKLCVNPDHLILGDHQDNMDDLVRAGTLKRGRPILRHLSAEQVTEIIARYKDKKRNCKGEPTYKSLAEEYGVTIHVI